MSSKGVKFVRYGGLSSVKQRGFTLDPEKETFHSPPARKGIYAFPQYWVEHFLLGGDMKSFGVRNRVVRVRDKKGELVTNRHPLFDKLSEKGSKYWDKTDGKLWPDAEPDEDGEYEWKDYIHYLTLNPTPRKFVYSGDIWHHLIEFVPKNKIIKQKADWVLTTMDVYKVAFAREMHNRRKSGIKDLGNWDPDSKIKDVNFLPRNPYKWQSKDNLEVFIERVK